LLGKHEWIELKKVEFGRGFGFHIGAGKFQQQINLVTIGIRVWFAFEKKQWTILLHR
jgi:hypothetical protein